MSPVALFIRGLHRPSQRKVFLDGKDVTAACIRAEQFPDGSGTVTLREICAEATMATLQGKVDIIINGDR